MATNYTDEKTTQIVLALLKKHGIKRVIASPGATNVSLVASMQTDPYFQLISCVDERSAAYIACGLAAETGEPVVISCTGATASQNYTPGLIEAFYRKLPVLAITSTQPVNRVGHHIAQVTDRSVLPRDTVKFSATLPIIRDADDLWECEVKVNQAILELRRRGGGPAHINMPTTYSRSFETKELPEARVIHRIQPGDAFPPLPVGKIGIFCGSHAEMSLEETAAIDAFCTTHDAVVFCDHTSGYRGRYRVLYALVAGQSINLAEHNPDVLIHIGEISGDYYSLKLSGAGVWRVNPDGEIRDTFRKLQCVFEMPERLFFEHYAQQPGTTTTAGKYLSTCQEDLGHMRKLIPDLPFSNAWLAATLAHRIPPDAVVHFGILNSLRCWNFFELPASVKTSCNVGGFGIDGCLSSLIGASLADPGRLYFCIIGDLATFYDMNVLGNHNIGPNVRVLMVNNGKGTEFRQYNHHAAIHGEDTDKFIAASGHFGNQSPTLMKQYVENLGFTYAGASTKEVFESALEPFVAPAMTDRPMFYEAFTNSEDESKALEILLSLQHETQGSAAKRFVKQALGARGVELLKKVAGKPTP